MSKRTVLNESYKGLVESLAIPAELHQRDGYTYASFGTTVPIHSCTPEQVSQYAASTHHYCDVFTEQPLAPLGELAYVRLDDTYAEKVFINRSKRILVTSSDGALAQWRCAASFESANRFVAGAPIVNQDGALVSLVTVRRGNHYAVSTFEGEGGYFETPKPWVVVEAPAGALLYGERSFATREELRAHVAALPPPGAAAAAEPPGPPEPPTPVLHRGASPRLALVAAGGRQLSHHYLHAVIANDVEYL